MIRLWPLVAAIGLVLAALDRPGCAAEDKKPAEKAAADKKAPAKKTAAKKKGEAKKKTVLTEPLVFAMEETPAFGKVEVDGRTQFRYPRGPYAQCTPEPSKQVKAYPKLRSKRPLYGSVTFDGSPFDSSVGKVYHFVLDESGLAEKLKEPKKDEARKETEEKTASAKKRPRPTRGTGDATNFDRFYFDLNGDLDLTNDPPLALAKESPFADLPTSASQRAFEDLLVPIDYGPPHGKLPFRIVAWFAAVGPDRAVVCFVPAVARKGTVRLGDEEYTAYLTQSRAISGRFDRPFVELSLSPTERSSKKPPTLKSGALGEVRLIDGRLVAVSASPLGDKLTIKPYAGDVGVLEVGPGGRTITNLGMVGSLASRTAVVPLGQPATSPSQTFPRRYTIPVGDYFPTTLTVQYGRLRFNSRMLADLTPSPGAQPAKAPVFNIKVRKDKPFALEFSGKPAVQFMTPREGQTFKPGDTVGIRAMLTEPWQGIMITGLWDSGQKSDAVKVLPIEKEGSTLQLTRLDPTIVIRDSQGKELSQGKMPFG